MTEVLVGVVLMVVVIVVLPVFAYILLALRAHMSDLNTKSAIQNTMLAQYSVNMIQGESKELAEAKAAKIIQESGGHEAEKQ